MNNNFNIKQKTYSITNTSGLVPPSKSSVFPDARVTTPSVTVAIVSGFVVIAYVLAPLGAVGVATTVNSVPVAISALVTVPVPVAVASVTSPVHPVICPSATTCMVYLKKYAYH